MIRGIAICLVLALAATSASRLACVWECVEVKGETHAAAACHEVPLSGPTLAASDAHCPLTPDGTAIWTAKGNEPQRMREVLEGARQPHPSEAAMIAPPVHPTGPPPLHHARGPAFQANSVRRI
jgi:hypothetical protein